MLAEVKKDHKQIRDQVHEVRMGQAALATREEVIEEITSQRKLRRRLRSRIDGS
jgi:hypothetical protein